MSELDESPGTFVGCGPSGAAMGEVLCEDDELVDEECDPDGDGEAEAAVTPTVSAAVGGVHVVGAVTVALAVSLTEVTVLALAATGICA
jgi:hypothetical protein